MKLSVTYLACGVLLCCHKTMTMDLNVLGKVLQDLKEILDVQQKQNTLVVKDKQKADENEVDGTSMVTKRTQVINLTPSSYTLKICRPSDFQSLLRSFCRPFHWTNRRLGKRGKQQCI